MQTVILILLLVLVSYILGERAFRAKRLPFESMLFLVYGTEFILIGILLGPYVFNILTTDLIDRLEPLTNIALGWIGLMFGFQFRVKDLKLLPIANFRVAAIESGVTFAVVLAVLAGTYLAFTGELVSQRFLPVELVLAALATVSSPAIIARIIKLTGSHGRVSRLMQYTSSFDNALGVVAFGLAYPFFHVTAQRGDIIIAGWGWLLITVASGAVLGLLFHFFTRARATSNENLMLAVGMVALSSGIAYYLHLSALFINLIVGAVLCNYSERQDRFYRLLIAAEKPLYGILLIMAAALWRFSWDLVLIAALFIAGRAAAKSAGSWAALSRHRAIIRYPALFGTGLIAQGGMALAIALDYRFLAPGEMSSLVVSVVLAAMVVNGALSPFAVRRVLRLEGETA